jgi:4'-phosphopantetheinyl transferase
MMPGTIDVDVIHARLVPSTDLSRLAAVLSTSEQARAAGYRVPESRDVFTLARGLLRLELGRRIGAHPGDLVFDLRASGKPDLRRGAEPRPDWRFSVSHTGPHVALAFAKGVDVGIDLERLGRPTNPLEIAKRYFTTRELAALEAAADTLRRPMFFAGWTRKEAIVKARGATMAESLKTLSVDLDPASAAPSYEDSPEVADRALCRVAAFTLDAQGLIGAVAVQADRMPRLNVTVLSGSRFD